MSEMSSESAYNACYDEFMAIPADNVTYCTVPTDISTAEARKIGVAAAQDREALISVDVPALAVDSLYTRAMAYTHAVILYETTINGDPVAVALWKALSARGYELQKYFDKYMTRAYRNDANYSHKMDELRKGRGPRDMIMDVGEYVSIAKSNPEPLNRVTAFDADTIAEAEALFPKLTDAYAKSCVDPKKVAATRDIMNRAWTYYKMAADEVKAGGQFLFEGTDRYNNYISEYHRILGKKSARAATETESPIESKAV
ncbi:MAG: hypothetical protein JXR76_24855 [Deltaproteobacteria bacterium]|nr:hypothetical protein [Deltaproteobacteria bacterium]